MVIVLKNPIDGARVVVSCQQTHEHVIFQEFDQALKYTVDSTSAYATKHAISKN